MQTLKEKIEKIPVATKLFFTIASVAAVIIIAGVGAGGIYTSRKIRKTVESDLILVSEMAADSIKARIDSLVFNAAISAHFIGIEWDNIVDDPQDPENLITVPGEWRDVTVADEINIYVHTGGFFKGIFIYDLDESASPSLYAHPKYAEFSEWMPPQEYFDGDYFKSSLNGNIGLSTTYYAWNTDGKPDPDSLVMYIAVPVYTELQLIEIDTGATITPEHIEIAAVDGLFFYDMLKDFTIIETGHIFVDDTEGTILANSDLSYVLNRNNFLKAYKATENKELKDVAELLSNAITGPSGIGSYKLNGESRICAYRQIDGTGFILGVVVPDKESPVRDSRNGFLIVALICTLLATAAVLFGTKYLKRPYAELEKSLEVSAKASLAKTEFLAHMSHEMRTPLNAVIGLSDIILNDETANLTPDTAEKVSEISSSSMTLLGIINDLLDISKTESGQFSLSPVEYDTASLLNDIAVINSFRIGEKSINFTVDAAASLPSRMLGDEIRIKQVFNNLISNAIKYTPSGSVVWKIQAEPSGIPDEVLIVSSVTDTGKGIKKEDIDLLFKNFSRVDINKNRHIEGTGLGLAITKNLAEMMGGSVTVASEYGVGSVFTVRFKQKVVGVKVLGEDISKALSSMKYNDSKQDLRKKLARTPMPYARVLVVDDVQTNLMVAKNLLKPYGITVDTVLSGKSALSLISNSDRTYDAVFMDHMMPEMDGIETLSHIRELGSPYALNLPVIALTANAVLGNEDVFLAGGFAAFIAKPIDIIRLDEVLNKYVRNPELEVALNSPVSVPRTAVLPFDGKTVDGIDFSQGLKWVDYDILDYIGVLQS
ncbi:MAG: response regulator, partial [Christensenellaceae bacterium]|nr:response regulator [Christensenellaceae bacterium]